VKREKKNDNKKNDKKVRQQCLILSRKSVQQEHNHRHQKRCN
jgi:hypothetical protein